MIYGIWGILGILSFFKKNSKTGLLVLTLFILAVFCFNTSNPDLYAYQQQYSASRPLFYTEPLFVALEFLFSNAGLSYEFFRFFLALVSLLLVVNTIYKYSPYPTLVLFLYSIYPLTIDVVQFRFFVGWTVILFAIRFIVAYQTEKKLKYILLYFLFLVLAAGCHYACILYGILGLMFFDIDKHKLLYFVIIPAGVIILLASIQRLLPLIASIIGGQKAYLWAERERSASILNILRVLVTSYTPLLLVVLAAFCKRSAAFLKIAGAHVPTGLKMFLGNITTKIQQDNSCFFNFRTNKTLFLCLFYIELFSFMQLTITIEYERMMRLGLIISAILISRLIYYMEEKNKTIWFTLLLLLFISYFSSVMFFMGRVQPHFERVFLEVMENNSLFGAFF